MQAFIGLGSNIGDRRHYLELAVQLIRQLPDTRLVRTSSAYRNRALTEDGHAGPDYLNAVVRLETRLLPFELLRALKNIENQLGRVRHGRWQPRTIDLDLLTYGDQQLKVPGLELPHPEVSSRDFVLLPLLEIAPAWRHPVLDLSARELVERLADSGQAGMVPTCYGSLS